MDQIGARIGVKDTDLTPWYNIDQKVLKKFGATGLLRHRYNFSHFAMLREVYPGHDWLPWKFKKLPSHVGRSSEILLRAVSFVETERNFTKPEDWYRVTGDLLRELGVFSIFKENGGLFASLMVARPSFSWDEEKFHKKIVRKGNEKGKEREEKEEKEKIPRKTPKTGKEKNS